MSYKNIIHTALRTGESLHWLIKRVNPATPMIQQRRSGRRHSSSRGKMNTPFSQFLEATLVIRKLIKYIFVIWALAMGIFALFYLPALPTFKNAGSNQNQQVSNNGDSASTVTDSASSATQATPTTNSQNENTLASVVKETDNNPAAGIVTEKPASTRPLLPVPATSTSASNPTSANESKTTSAATSLPVLSDPNNTLTVAAYRATLFSSITTDNATTTPLKKDELVTVRERHGEWLKVTVNKTGQSGFIHSTQVQ